MRVTHVKGDRLGGQGAEFVVRLTPADANALYAQLGLIERPAGPQAELYLKLGEARPPEPRSFVGWYDGSKESLPVTDEMVNSRSRFKSDGLPIQHRVTMVGDTAVACTCEHFTYRAAVCHHRSVAAGRRARAS